MGRGGGRGACSRRPGCTGRPCPPATWGGPLGAQSASPSVQGAGTGRGQAGRRARGRPVGQHVLGGHSAIPQGPRQRQPREDGDEKSTENQGAETRGQQPPRRWYRCNFNCGCRLPERPKPQEGKETRAADPPAENSSAPKAGLGTSLLSLPASSLVIQQNMNMKFQQ